MSHQALKAQATRDRILNAVVYLINESGYGAATSSAIAKRANITWGAVQHHFGNKEEIMIAVMEMASDVYMDSLKCPMLRQGTLEQRIDRFVNLVWEHYKSDLYFAFTEIVMASRGPNSGLIFSQERMHKQVEKNLTILNSLFSDQKIAQHKVEEALRYGHRFLAGFALDRLLDPSQPYETRHLKRLKQELLHSLEGH